MPIDGLAETWAGRVGSIHGRFVRDYERIYVCHTTSPLDGPETILLTSGLPRLFFPYAEDSGFVDLGARCYSVDPQQDQDDPQTWKIVVKYSSDLSHIAEIANRPPSEPYGNQTVGGRGSATDPLSRPPVIKWGTVKYQRPIWQDLRGQACVNAAGERFDPPIEIDDSRPVLTITKNLASWDESQALLYQDAVNTDAWSGFAPLQAKVDTWEATFKFEEGFAYWESTIVIHGRREKWHPFQVLNCGFHELKNGKLSDIVLPNGSSPSSPVLLDANGRMLQPPYTFGPSGNVTYLNLYPFKELPFSGLPFP